MEETIEFVRKWNRESAKDGLNKIIKFKEEEAYDKAYDEACEKTLIEMAKNMLKDNIDFKIIKKYTHLSSKVLNKLKNELD